MGSDEKRWVIEIRSFIKDASKEDEMTPVCIFSVPKSLAVVHPEAYSPQLISIGPYHHREDDLHEMDRHKLLVAKRVIENKCKGLSFDDIVKEILKFEPRIRACYHKHLEMEGETLAWLLSIDGLFLLEFLHNYGEKNDSVLASSSKTSYLVDARGRKVGYDSILKDMLMLENQVPLFVLRKIFKLQCQCLFGSSGYNYKDLLATMLLGVCRELSPLIFTDDLKPTQVVHHLHLLDLLYHLIVPSELLDVEEENGPKEDQDQDKDQEEDDDDDKEKHNKSSKGSVSGTEIFSNLWSMLLKCNVQILKGIKVIMFGKPMKVILKLPWKLLSKLPLVSLIGPAIEGCLSNSNPDKESIQLVDEIMIPAVTSLSNVRVNFVPSKGGIVTIKFDRNTLQFSLPQVELDINSEVIMRNLVAYESLSVSGPLVLARYIEFMNGIIDTAEDARVLRKKKIIYNHLKSDQEVADLWNGMSRCVRLTKVGFLDEAIEVLKEYYEGTWRVKGYKLVMKWVYGSWEVILLLGAFLLLSLMALQAFCSVYACPRLFDITSTTDG